PHPDRQEHYGSMLRKPGRGTSFMAGLRCTEWVQTSAPHARSWISPDLYGAFPVKRLFLGFPPSSLFGAGKAVLRPVACDQVRGARGRGQGTETLAELGGVPP